MQASLFPVTQSAPPGEPTSLSLATSYRDVDRGPDRDAVGAFVCGSGFASYGTGFRCSEGGRKERSGERSSRGEIVSRRLSESLSWADFTFVDSPTGSDASYAKSCICKLTSACTG